MRLRLAESDGTASCACGCLDLFAVQPGVEPVRLDAIDLFTRRDKVAEAGVADAAFCRGCWIKKWGKRRRRA